MQQMQRYAVDVVGMTWGGFQSAYTYHTQPQGELPTPMQVKSLAGDFELVEDYRVHHTALEIQRVSVRERWTTSKHIIDQDWQQEDSESVYAECLGEA